MVEHPSGLPTRVDPPADTRIRVRGSTRDAGRWLSSPRTAYRVAAFSSFRSSAKGVAVYDAITCLRSDFGQPQFFER